MKELIKIRRSPNTGNPIVNARDLHAFLEVNRQFSNWIIEKIKKYGFVENEDYARLFYDVYGNRIPLNKNVKSDIQRVNRIHRVEYALTMECAKELSMVQNNEKGRQARRYFIGVEKKYRELREGKRRLYNMSEIVRILNLSDYYGKIGRNGFYNILYYQNIVDKKNKPLKKYVDRGYFTKYPTRVTEEGLNWLREKFSMGETKEIARLNEVVENLHENQELMISGIKSVVETLFFNKGGKRTEEQNRVAISHLQGFLNMVDARQKVLK